MIPPAPQRQRFIRFVTRDNFAAVVALSDSPFAADLPHPWRRFGYVVTTLGFLPVLWTHEGHFREDHASHAFDLASNHGECEVGQISIALG